MSKPIGLNEILDKFDAEINVGVAWGEAIQQIKELFQSILLEYKEKQLGREGIRILNELHERVEKL